MEILNEKYQNFLNAYNSLGRSLEVQKQLQAIAAKNSDLQDLFIAGIIQHFELTYETAWKFLKQYLKHVHGVDIASPKAVFRSCREMNVLSEPVVNELLELADIRNVTTHVYDRLLAQEVCLSIEKHYKIFGILTKIMDGC